MLLTGALVLLAVVGDAAEPGLTDLDRRVLEALTGTREAGAVVVHFDPATVRAADAEAEAARARAALVSLEERLDARLEGKAHLFLYADLAEFRARTGAPAAWEGFAAGPSSVHVPRGAPLRHELTHLLARRFAGPSARDPGGLLREGLAVAMEGTDRGIPASSFAAVYARLGLLPALADLRDRWPAGPPKEFHPYHAAGSFVEWLLATEGLAKAKALYGDPARAREILGRTLEEAEPAWRAWLEARPVPEAEEDAVRREYLLPTARLPEALAKEPGVPLVEGLTLEGGDSWRIHEIDRRWSGEYALRVVARVGPGAGLLLRVNRSEGRSDEALLTPEGVGVTLLAQEKGTARLYLDGRLVVEAKGAFGAAGGTAALGARGGTVEVRSAAAVPSGK
jgi:hypothetical protein